MSTNGRDHPTLSRFQNCTQMYHRFYMHNIVAYVLRCYSYKNQTSIFAILTRLNYFAGKLVRGDRCSNNTNFCVSYRGWSLWFDNRHIVWGSFWLISVTIFISPLGWEKCRLFLRWLTVCYHFFILYRYIDRSINKYLHIDNYHVSNLHVPLYLLCCV